MTNAPRHSWQHGESGSAGPGRVSLVGRAVKTWTGELVDLGGRNTLLYYRDLKQGTLGRPRRFRTAETVFSKPLPAMPGTRCGPPAEAGTRLPSEDASDCNAVRCSAQYHAWPFRGWDRLCGTRALS